MRKKVVNLAANDSGQLYSLLAALSADLALPLVQIKSVLELIGSDNFSKSGLPSNFETIQNSADNGLQLIEAYRLVLNFGNINSMHLEPVAVGAILQEVAHSLTSYAKQYNTTLEIDVAHNLAPVLAHQPSLKAAIQVLSSSMIRAQVATVEQNNYRLLLAAHRGAEDAISTGVFSNITGLSDKTLRSARLLMGKARQPMPNVPVGAASGILIADMLCSAMWQPLRAAAHGGLHGLATGLPISQQMHFV